MKVVLLSRDLLAISKFRGAAERQQAEVAVAGSGAELVALAEAGDVGLAIIDLGLPGCVPAELVPALRGAAHPPRAVLAFGPHVQEERLRLAREAGCDEVFSRGEFHARMD